MRLTRWMCILLLACLSVTPLFAHADDTTKAKAPAVAPASNDGGDSSTNKNSSSSPAPVANAKVAALLDVLVKKGILAPAEASQIRSASPDAELQLLVDALNRKGILNAADLSAVADSGPASSTPAAAAPAFVASSASPDAPTSSVSSTEMTQSGNPQTQTQAAGAEPQSSKPTPRGIVPAVTPIRALPIDPPAKDGLVAAFKAGAVKITPYGFIKASAVHDSSSPNGDDFPFVGLFLSSTSILNTGPTADPEFHLKARSTRFGANFEWPDPSPKLVVTGRIEGDFEGNFSEVDNRDVSSIRSNALQLRLAYARLDYEATDRWDFFFEGGQDWAIFSSTVLPNLFETTFLGAYYGTLYERSPQFRFGTTYKVSEWRNTKISPEFAIMMPSTGQIEKLGTLGLQGQIGQGEREGADSGKPELESRVVLQFQLDKAPGVASAQLFWAGFYSRRTSIVTTSNYGTPTASCLANLVLCNLYETAFPNGFTTSSKQYGNQAGFQLPTRFATLIGSAYFGGDLRFFFGGQVNSYATDITGLSNPITFATVDGGPLAAAGAATLATVTGTNLVAIAPQKPIRSFGGFLNLGLPVSRWFNADPKGRMGGWQVYLHIGKDQVVHRDLTNPNYAASANTLSPLPLLMGKMFAATLYYKLNPWCTFGTEYSVYASRLAPGLTYSIAGSPSNEWQDHRIEFGPVFTF
ncbi:MAG: hypothetical protein ABSB65_14995 [Candidatus Acidiferrales bacterium]